MTQTASKSNPDAYQPLLLASRQLLDRYWPGCEVHIQRCIDNTVMCTETSALDVYQAVLAGKAHIWAVVAELEEGPDVKFTMAVEVVDYPKLTALNILAIGGEELLLFHNKFWGAFKGWAFMTGIRAIEGYVSESMERIVKRFGFERTSIHVRLSLTGE